jgi:hypothetical protein
MHGSSGIENFIFGSNAFAAIKNLHHPVLAVPLQYTYKPIQTVALAVDLSAVAVSTKSLIVQMLQLFNTEQLHIVHVKNEDEEENIQPALVQQLHELTGLPGHRT